MPGPVTSFVSANRNLKIVLSLDTGGPAYGNGPVYPTGVPRSPVLIAPLMDEPEMVSFKVTQLRFPMEGSNCWKVKLSALAVVGAIVID